MSVNIEMIPAFLADIYVRKSGIAGLTGSSLLGSYRKEEKRRILMNWIAAVSVIVCLVALMIAGMAESRDNLGWLIYESLYDHQAWFIGTAIATSIPAVVGFVLAVQLESATGHKFIQTVEAMFATFGIKPSATLAAMSQEEFRAIVEEYLVTLAKAVDAAQGFNKVDWRDAFNEKHKVALSWGMCHREHAKYYPKKPKV